MPILPVNDAKGMSGKELRKARDVLEYPQWEMAQLLGITNGTLSKYETGKRPIPLVVELAVSALLFIKQIRLLEEEIAEKDKRIKSLEERWGIE